jgi:hypothetical protein
VAEARDEFGGLRDAIDAFAADMAPDVVAEARAEAILRARRMLAEAMLESLLERAGTELRGGGKPRSSAPPEAAQRPREERRPERTTARAQAKERRRGSEQGCYVYGVTWAAGARLPENLPGVDPGDDASLIAHGDLAAITSVVSLSEFGEEELRGNLNDVEWLEQKARAHEHVLDEALARMTVVPMRLCTIYESEGRIRQMLERERLVFMEALDRLAGKTEWGVKVIAEPDAVERAAVGNGQDGDEAGAASAGVAYLRQRSRENRARERGTEIAEEWAADAHELLAANASEALRNPLQNPELSGEIGEMLLNGVYLVDDEEIDAFRHAVDDLNRRFSPKGVRAELTGPWPPYNFVKGSIEAAR